MGYHSEFLRARNINGELYRDDRGELIEYCSHNYYLKAVFSQEQEYHAEIIEENCTRFERFEAVCILCGHYTFIDKSHVLTPDEWDKAIEERVKNIKEEDKEDA